MKPAGAIIILLGGFSTLWMYSRGLRRSLALIRDLSSALEQVAGEIRWRLLPVPVAIDGVSKRAISGSFFQRILRYMESGNTLQEAWGQALSDLPQEVIEVLARMEWGGDLERQESAIQYAAKQLRELGEEKKAELRQKEKLCAAAALSAAGLLVLILI